MKVLDYLKKEMTDFVSAFKNAKVTYEYDELAKIHTIEILPQSLFESVEFAKWECEFFKEAFNFIPGEDVGFISEDAYVGIQHVDWTLHGSEYFSKDDMLDNHISKNDAFDILENNNGEISEFKTMQHLPYNVFNVIISECVGFEQNDNPVMGIKVLDSNDTIMSLEDNLMQAA